MNPNIAHIVYASDDRFAEILGVSLVSLYENNVDMYDLVVYILDSNISQENKEKLNGIPKDYNRSDLVWIKAQDISEVLSIEVTIDRGSLSQYARLFISSNLPDDIDRVLYLDCDTLIVKSIKELWNLDLQGKTVGALKDAFSFAYRANINLHKNDIMFNSGVMLIDLKKWKENNVENRLLKFIEKKNGNIQQGDQGALNAVLSYETYCFNPKFNAVTIFFDFDYEEMLIYRKPPERYYSKEEIKAATSNPVIVHFTTSLLSKRPWIVGCKHKYVDEWLKYKKKGPWANEPLWNDNKKLVRKSIVNLLKRLPRKIMIQICGIAQAYGRPLKNRVLYKR